MRFDPITFSLASAMVWAVPAWCADFPTQAEAQHALFPGASAFTERPLTLTAEQRKRIRELSGVTQRSETQKVWQATRDGAKLGWFVVDEVIGKHEYITYAAGLSPTGVVLGIEILAYRETHGGQIRDAAWRKVFTGKTLDQKFELDVDVPNISGATLSCRNVTNGVKRLLALQKVALDDG